MRHSKWLYILIGIVGVVAVAAWFALRPWFYVRSDQGIMAQSAAVAGLPFSIHFIHSVQKTPVLENLVINDTVDGFDLESTKYQSFGVGLPFLEGEGTFREEGDYFIFSDMDRHFHTLSLRTGVGTALTVTVQGREYKLYESLPPGSRIDIYIAPYYTQFIQP
jgi:hypothetical protein